MTDNKSYVTNLLNRHYTECVDGLVDSPPSSLRRGEGTERDFFIFKIDLSQSTQMFLSRHKATYLKVAHTFLSTVDAITKDYGADSDQTEYAGDSVLAYFPSTTVSAESVLKAATLSRWAVNQMQGLDATLKSLKPSSKVIIHNGALIVSKIGPWAGSILTAIGMDIHRVAKLEKSIGAAEGWATMEYYSKLAKVNRKFFESIYEEQTEWISNPAYIAYLLRTPQQRLADIVYGSSAIAPPPQVLNNTKKLVGYKTKWPMLEHALGLR